MLGNGVFDDKLQDPWALLLRSSFSPKRNCMTLVLSNSVILFFDETFQFHHFSIKPSCCFFTKNSLDHYILQFCGKDLAVAWQSETLILKYVKGTIR